MDSRERMLAALDFEETDRLPRYEAFWWETVEAFRGEGMGDAEIEDYFDLDIRLIEPERTFLLPEETIEETEEYRIFTDGYGFKQKVWKTHQSTPELIDFAVKTKEMWYEHYREMNEYRPARLKLEENRAAYDRFRKAGRYVAFAAIGPFEQTWRKIGSVEQLMGLAMEPEWLKDLYEVDTEMNVACFEEMWGAGIEFDGLWMWEDLAYKNGPMISPEMYREFLMPMHKMLSGAVHARGGKIIMHTCGNNDKLVELYIEAGIDCLQAMEVKAGMDVRRLKGRCGDVMSFMGNIDARLFQNNDVEGLEKEIREKLSVAAKGGGYIFHSDHSIPPGTKLTTYRRALEVSEEF